MKWKLELDALIESTMAFAKDIKRGQPIADLPVAMRTAEQALAETSTPIPPFHDYSATGFASVTAQRNPRARKQF